MGGIFACTSPRVECGLGAFLPRILPGQRRLDRAGVTGHVWWDLGAWMHFSEREAVPECFDGTLVLGLPQLSLLVFPSDLGKGNGETYPHPPLALLPSALLRQRKVRSSEPCLSCHGCPQTPPCALFGLRLLSKHMWCVCVLTWGLDIWKPCFVKTRGVLGFT